MEGREKSTLIFTKGSYEEKGRRKRNLVQSENIELLEELEIQHIYASFFLFLVVVLELRNFA